MKRKEEHSNEVVEAHVFDQTNGLVDLGTESERQDPDAERNLSRRQSSMNAIGIAYGNGTR